MLSLGLRSRAARQPQAKGRVSNALYYEVPDFLGLYGFLYSPGLSFSVFLSQPPGSGVGFPVGTTGAERGSSAIFLSANPSNQKRPLPHHVTPAAHVSAPTFLSLPCGSCQS